MSDRSAVSLWARTAAEPDCQAPLADGSRVDLAIVGGGFTGLSTALHGAERGLACHVLEAQSIGYGGSGRNVGLVNAGLWLPPQDVRAKMGEARGAALVRGPAIVNPHDLVFVGTPSEGEITAAHAALLAVGILVR